MQNGESAQRRNPHAIRAVTAFGRTAVAATWAFVSSRRWLVAATLATCALLAVFLLGKPKPIHILQEPEAPETTFDDVTNLGVQSNGWFHRWLADAANNSEKGAPGVTLSAPPADDSEPPESTRLTRRLDAVRSRQSKGAVLTGKIDTGKPRLATRSPGNLPTHRCGRLLASRHHRPPTPAVTRCIRRPSRSFDEMQAKHVSPRRGDVRAILGSGLPSV